MPELTPASDLTRRLTEAERRVAQLEAELRRLASTMATPQRYAGADQFWAQVQTVGATNVTAKRLTTAGAVDSAFTVELLSFGDTATTVGSENPANCFPHIAVGTKIIVTRLPKPPPATGTAYYVLWPYGVIGCP